MARAGRGRRAALVAAACLAAALVACADAVPKAWAAELEGFEEDEGDQYFTADAFDKGAQGKEELKRPPKMDREEMLKAAKEMKRDKLKQELAKAEANRDPDYVPWGERNFTYWINAFDAFSKAMVKDFKFELALIVFIGLYAMNYMHGSRQNEGVVLAWANTFGIQSDHTIYGRNFSQVGLDTKSQASEIIFRESQSSFKCYATGRRFCESAMTTLDLKKRQDVWSLLISLVSPSPDRLRIEVNMNPASMPPMVFAVAKRKDAKKLVESQKDIQMFAKMCEPSKERASTWPRKLTILSETRDLQNDVISSTAMKNVFSAEAFRSVEKYFESIHFTSEAQEGHKHVLRFNFKLPPPDRMSAITGLMEYVFHQIDVIGSLKISGEALKRAEQRRKEIEAKQFKDAHSVRQETAQRKREERLQKEMSPSQIAKFEEKRRRKKQNKQIKIMKSA